MHGLRVLVLLSGGGYFRLAIMVGVCVGCHFGQAKWLSLSGAARTVRPLISGKEMVFMGEHFREFRRDVVTIPLNPQRP